MLYLLHATLLSPAALAITNATPKLRCRSPYLPCFLPRYIFCVYSYKGRKHFDAIRKTGVVYPLGVLSSSDILDHRKGAELAGMWDKHFAGIWAVRANCADIWVARPICVPV